MTDVKFEKRSLCAFETMDVEDEPMSNFKNGKRKASRGQRDQKLVRTPGGSEHGPGRG